MNKRFSHGKFCGEGKKRKSQMHPASHQEETANLVEKAQVQKKTNKQKNTNNTETQRVSFMAQQSLN